MEQRDYFLILVLLVLSLILTVFDSQEEAACIAVEKTSTKPGYTNPNGSVSRGRMYSYSRPDRSGSFILDMIMAHRQAFLEGYEYVGACGYSDYHPSHQELLNALGIADSFLLACPTDHSNSIILKRGQYARPRRYYRFLGPPEWLRKLRSQVQYPNRKDNDDSLHMAVHIRRGDVTPCIFKRYLPNSYFLELIDRMLETSAKETRVQVTIYSQKESFEDFEVFHQRGFAVSLESAAAAWQGMVTSDVLITSDSHFSHVPALFARGRVLFVSELVSNAQKKEKIHIPEHWETVSEHVLERAWEENERLRQSECQGVDFIPV